MTIDVGEMLGDYEVLTPLCAGGVGRVYKARHCITGRIEALKVLLPDYAQDDQKAERFLREVKVQANLNHPNIASILNAFRVGSSLIMVMELVEGESLDRIVARGRLPLGQAIDYASQALSALNYAHSCGVIHRDIKPGNMLVAATGRLKVADFGLAKTATDARLTVTGATLGSLHYMSPEQVKGVPTLDERTDIYSMGVVLYELATGRRPFEGEQPFHLMLAHVEERAKPPSEIDPSLPASLSDVILRALEKRPEARFESAEEFQLAVEAAARTVGNEPGISTLRYTRATEAAARTLPPAARHEPPRRFAVNRRWIALLFLTVLASLAAFVAWRSLRPDPRKTLAVPSGNHQLLRKVIPEGIVRAVAFSGGGELAAVLTDRGMVEVWDPQSGERRTTFSDVDTRSTALALSQDGSVIVFPANGSSLRLGDASTGVERLRLEVERDVRSVATTSDGGLLAAASDSFVTVWEIDSARRKEPLHQQELKARAVTFAPDGSTVAFATEHHVRVQSLRQPGMPVHVSAFDGATALAANPEKGLLAAAGSDGLKIWNIDTFEEVLAAKLPGIAWGLGFALSGQCVALTSTGQSAQIWIEGTEVSAFLHDHEVETAALSADGHFAATATAAGDLWFWRADAARDRPDEGPQEGVSHRFGSESPQEVPGVEDAHNAGPEEEDGGGQEEPNHKKMKPRKNLFRRFIDIFPGGKR